MVGMCFVSVIRPMNESSAPSPDQPPWAGDDAFPVSPGGFGWMDARGKLRTCGSLDELTGQIAETYGDTVFLAWLPGDSRMRLPEEIPALADALDKARRRGAREDRMVARWRLRWFGGLLGIMAAWVWLNGFFLAAGGLARRLAGGLRAVLESQAVGLALLMFVVFGFIPWYRTRKRRAELEHWNPANDTPLLPIWRFEAWLHLQRAPVTKLIMGLLAAVFVVQCWSDGSLMGGQRSILAAGLVKEAYQHGDWWRLFTAPLLHGGIVHFLLNAAALLYLGKRLEALASWPHLPLVFLFAALVGGAASASLVAATSVGASGGLMGWLGFLIVFETLHPRLVPRSARKRLVAGVLLTSLIGVLGYRFIDNAAHAGGLFAGMAYAAIVFPKSASGTRPAITLTDRLAGAFALLVLAATTLFTALLIGRGPA